MLSDWVIGRAPWYDSEECRPKTPLIIGVTGGTASGKTTVCSYILNHIQTQWVSLISMDSFYRPLTPEERQNVESYNFDCPSFDCAFDWELFEKTLTDIKQGKSVLIPVYDFKTHSRLLKTVRVYGADVVIVEGILTLWSAKVRRILDLKIFVDADADLRLARRIRRDIAERGRTVEGVLSQYEKTVKPSFEEFISPTKSFANLIIPYSTENPVAVALLAQHVSSQLTQRSLEFRMEQESKAPISSDSKAQDDVDFVDMNSVPGLLVPRQVHLLEDTAALRAIHTHIRDRGCHQDEFLFQVDRLNRLVIEAALSECVFKFAEVMAFDRRHFSGALPVSKLCGVSIVRSGEAMESGLRQVCRDVRIGKIVIQQSPELKNGPRLYYCKLPADIQDRKVVLMDPVLGAPHVVKMAVRVLLDHGVLESNIIYAALIVTASGVISLCQTFPRLTVVASAVDDIDNDSHFARPGLGCFGERYFHLMSNLNQV